MEENMSDDKPANSTAKYGLLMAGGFVGAIILFVLNALPAVFAFIVGGVLLFFGYGILSSKNEKDTLAGLALAVTGAITILSNFPIVKFIAGWLLQGGAIVLLVMGVWNCIRFVMSVKNRSD